MATFERFHPVLSLLSYLLKAPLVPPGTPVVNALAAQRQVINCICFVINAAVFLLLFSFVILRLIVAVSSQRISCVRWPPSWGLYDLGTQGATTPYPMNHQYCILMYFTVMFFHVHSDSFLNECGSQECASLVRYWNHPPYLGIFKLTAIVIFVVLMMI